MSTTPSTTPITPAACPNPGKLAFANKNAADTFEQTKRSQYGEQWSYLCQCTKWHLTTNDPSLTRVVGGPTIPNSSSWMSNTVVPPKMTHTDKVIACLTKYNGSRTAKEISDELSCEVSLVYTCSKASGIPYLRGGPQVSYDSGLQTLSGIAARKAQMLLDMEELEKREAAIKIEMVERLKCKVRMSDLNDGNVVISASQRELRLTPDQFAQLVERVKTFVVVPAVPKVAA